MLERLLGFSCDAASHQLKLAKNVTDAAANEYETPCLDCSGYGYLVT